MACWRGLQACAGEWVLFLEDDLEHWSSLLTAMADALAGSFELVSVNRGATGRRVGMFRSAVQPLVRLAFRFASGTRLDDPTSPLKAMRRDAFAQSRLERWADCLAEGLVVCANRQHEISVAGLRWQAHPSRYSVAQVAAMAIRLAPRLLMHGLARRIRR